MKTGLFLFFFAILVTIRVSGQDTSDFRKVLDSIHQSFLENPMVRRVQVKLSRSEIKLYNGIIYNYLDTSCINSKAAGESPENICSRIRNLLHEYHYYIVHHPSPEMHMIDVREPQWKLLTNTMGIYNNGVIWFAFRFNPTNNKIIWLSEIINPVRNIDR